MRLTTEEGSFKRARVVMKYNAPAKGYLCHLAPEITATAVAGVISTPDGTFNTPRRVKRRNALPRTRRGALPGTRTVTVVKSAPDGTFNVTWRDGTLNNTWRDGTLNNT